MLRRKGIKQFFPEETLSPFFDVDLCLTLSQSYGKCFANSPSPPPALVRAEALPV